MAVFVAVIFLTSATCYEVFAALGQEASMRLIAYVRYITKCA